MARSGSSNPGSKRGGGEKVPGTKGRVGKDPDYVDPGKALREARKKGKRSQLGTPPRASGGTINGASTSTTRVGY